MLTWAVLNQKGGSGKSTAAVNLAAALGALGVRVLLVDLDPQASASSWLGITDEGRGLLEVWTDGAPLEALVRETAVPHVSLVPASPWLVGLDRALAAEPGAETLFRRALAALPARWDLVLLDCPPHLGLVSISALVAARGVLVPVEASALGLAGLAALRQTVETVRDRLNPSLAIAAILPSRVDTRTTLGREVVSELRRRFPGLVTETVIRESVRVREAWSFAQPVTVYAPTSTGAADFTAAAAELLTRISPARATKTPTKKGPRPHAR